MDNLTEGLKLMIIGMTTVFCVLLLIIYFGKALISLVNKFFPEEEKNIAKSVATAKSADPQVAQAIALAVQQLTNGKGKVEKIEKL